MSARGKADVERLLAQGGLERVGPSSAVADRLLADAEAHVRLAARGTADDPAGALQLAYDAARTSCAALLAVQGIRATTRGGHVAVIAAVRAQFGGDGGEVFTRVDRLRRRRNRSDYPAPGSPGVTEAEAEDARSTASASIEAARRILGTGDLGPFA